MIGAVGNNFQFLLYLFKIFFSRFVLLLMFSCVQISLNKLHLNKSPQVFYGENKVDIIYQIGESISLCNL